MNSKISREKISAYRATDYHVLDDGLRVVLRVGRQEPKLKALLETSSRPTAAFITAYNPLGAQAGEACNKSAQIQLMRQLERVCDTIFRGHGTDPTGAWPPEPSLFAIGIAYKDACTIASQFGQDAIVWVDHKCIPELVLLR